MCYSMESLLEIMAIPDFHPWGQRVGLQGPKGSKGRCKMSHRINLMGPLMFCFGPRGDLERPRKLFRGPRGLMRGAIGFLGVKVDPMGQSGWFDEFSDDS